MRDIWEKQCNRLEAMLEAATRHSNTIDSEATRMSGDVESFIGTRAAESFTNRAVVNKARCTGDVFRDLPALHHLEVQLNRLTVFRVLSALHHLEVQLNCLIVRRDRPALHHLEVQLNCLIVRRDRSALHHLEVQFICLIVRRDLPALHHLEVQLNRLTVFRVVPALHHLEVQLNCLIVRRDRPALHHLEVQLNCLIQLSGQSCLERDNIGDEKDKVLKRIGAENKQPNTVKNNKPYGFTRTKGQLLGHMCSANRSSFLKIFFYLYFGLVLFR